VSRPFADIVRDSRIIPGIHHYCDEWCERCPHTHRCLAFRCEAAYRKLNGRSGSEPTFRTKVEAQAFARQLAVAEGAGAPEGNPSLTGSREAGGLRTGDPLARAAWDYALGVSMWLVLSPDDLQQLRSGSSPSSEEIVLWFHLRIYLKLVRALIAQECARAGRPVQSDEANGFAKLALVSVRRSRQALLHLKATGVCVADNSLLALLDTLERGIDERFPDARGFARIGLDVPAA
jgi:hypothetical protein